MNWRAEKLEREMEEYIKDSIKIEIEVKKAKKITLKRGRNIVIEELNNWKQKKNIMSKKKGLKKGFII